MLKMRYWWEKDKLYNVVFINCGSLNQNKNYENKIVIFISVQMAQRIAEKYQCSSKGPY